MSSSSVCVYLYPISSSGGGAIINSPGEEEGGARRRRHGLTRVLGEREEDIKREEEESLPLFWGRLGAQNSGEKGEGVHTQNGEEEKRSVSWDEDSPIHRIISSVICQHVLWQYMSSEKFKFGESRPFARSTRWSTFTHSLTQRRRKMKEGKEEEEHECRPRGGGRRRGDRKGKEGTRWPCGTISAQERLKKLQQRI